MEVILKNRTGPQLRILRNEMEGILVLHAPAFARRQIALAAIDLPAASAGEPGRNAAPFPVLAGDEKTAGAYSILYRYLFDRRRELRPPVAFLIDNRGQITRIRRSL